MLTGCCLTAEEEHDNKRASLVAILNAFCDESGKLADSEVVSFAGAVAFEEDWKAVSREWGNALRDEQLPFVKMSDAINLQGPFKQCLSHVNRVGGGQSLSICKDFVKRRQSCGHSDHGPPPVSIQSAYVLLCKPCW